MQLKLKHIIRWEQIVNKPFSKLELNNIKDLTALLYTYSEKQIPFSTFEKLIQGKSLVKLFNKLNDYLTYSNQFQKAGSNSEKGSDVDVYIQEIAALFILKGVDATFVYEQLELCDIPIFMKQLELQEQSNLEEKRFWTYLSILPHVDPKGLQTPQDLLLYPWEEKAVQEKKEHQIKESIEGFEEFLSSQNKEV